MYQVLFQYGPFILPTFNVLVAIGFILAIFFLLRLMNRQKMNVLFFARHFHYFIIAAIVAGRLGFILENLSFFKENPLQGLMIWDLNFSPFGALYGAGLTLAYFCRKAGEDFWEWADAFVLSGLTALFFTHLGRFFEGSDYGLPSGLPWAMTFDNESIPFASPIHPTQLYSALLTFLVLAFSMRKFKRTHLSGLAGSLACMLYSLGQLGIDFLHGNPSVYVKISFGLIAALSFVGLIQCSHKKMDLPTVND